MKDEPQSPLRHLEHPSPTVIHHPEDDETLLARWLRRAMEKGPRFWALLAGSAVALAAVLVLLNGLLVGESTSAQAWKELELAKTPSEQVEVANKYRETAPGRWAMLQAAGSIYNEGFIELPSNRTKAEPLLKRAYDLYSDVYEAASKIDPVQARFAAMGMARALEASNDRERAIEQYRLVARTWPDSEEGRRAGRRAEELEKPQNAEFYKWLAAYKPTEMTLPPLGKGVFDLPAGHPPIGGSASILDDEAKAAGSTATTGGDLPPDVFAPPSPADEAPKAGAGVKAGDVPAPTTDEAPRP